MRVLIVAVGSRGDVAPLTGLGAALRDAGHGVTLAGYEMFAGQVTGCGLAFHALPGDPRLLDAASWQRHGTGPIGAVRLVRLIADHLRELNRGILAAARVGADVLLLQGIGAIGGYHIAQGLGVSSMGLMLQPVAPTVEFAPSIVTARSLGRIGNRAAGNALVALGTPAMSGPVREIRAELGLSRLRARDAVYRRPDAERWPVFHGFSPSVVRRPPDWREGLEVVGYWWPTRPSAWSPPADLADFLDAGPPPVFVGFGSMTPADVARLSDLAVAAGRQAGVRTIIQAGPAGLAQANQAADTIVIGDMPHDWLFPQMAAVVHHAGAGTTAAGLRAGVPAVGVPMISDQPFWAARIAALGAGPRPIPYKRLTTAALAAAIRDATTCPSYGVRARDIASRLVREDGAAPIISALTRLPN